MATTVIELPVVKKTRRPASPRIRVLATDIKNGERQHSQACPIALAVRRRFPDASEVTVSTEVMAFYLKGRTHHAALPSIARFFINEFDAGHPVAPISFELELED